MGRKRPAGRQFETRSSDDRVKVRLDVDLPERRKLLFSAQRCKVEELRANTSRSS